MKKWIVLLALPLLFTCKKTVEAPVIPREEEESTPVDVVPNYIQKVTYTHPMPSGNRLIQGRGGDNPVVIDIELSGKPLWLTSISSIDFSYWVVVLDDGEVESFIVRPDRAVIPVGLPLEKLPVGMPPTLALDTSGKPILINSTNDDISTESTPVVLSTGQTIHTSKTGDLIVNPGDNQINLEINALPDARAVINTAEELAILTDPTSDYRHGVLGDAIEAKAITIIRTEPDFQILNKIEMPGQSVIEGIQPMWVDLDEDGEEEILVTLSNNGTAAGAKLVAFKKDGTILAEGPLSPGGWRHQLAVFRPSANAPLYIVDCQKPHVQRILNFYQLVGNELQIVASKSGYSTHQIGRRNLDMAMAGDFDRDGVKEMIVPSSDYSEVRSIVMDNGDLLERRYLNASGKISTNFSATPLDGLLILGVGMENGILRLWM